jgi:DNA-binding NarL/FixJ family response regulator
MSPGSGPDEDSVLRIVIADDQNSVREGLVLLLGLLPGIEVVASAADGKQAIERVAEHRPDAILLDLHMPVLDGVETAKALTAQYPDTAIVVLTTYADDASVLAALQAGARGYLTKDADRQDIASALRSAASGLSVLDPVLQAALVAAAGSGKVTRAARSGPLPDGLTPREAEILTLVAQGLTNPEIAQELVLSHHTIKTHINRIFAKTDSRDRAAAVRYAQANGLG